MDGYEEERREEKEVEVQRVVLCDEDKKMVLTHSNFAKLLATIDLLQIRVQALESSSTEQRPPRGPLSRPASASMLAQSNKENEKLKKEMEQMSKAHKEVVKELESQKVELMEACEELREENRALQVENLALTEKVEDLLEENDCEDLHNENNALRLKNEELLGLLGSGRDINYDWWRYNKELLARNRNQKELLDKLAPHLRVEVITLEETPTPTHEKKQEVKPVETPKRVTRSMTKK